MRGMNGVEGNQLSKASKPRAEESIEGAKNVKRDKKK